MRMPSTPPSIISDIAIIPINFVGEQFTDFGITIDGFYLIAWQAATGLPRIFVSTTLSLVLTNATYPTGALIPGGAMNLGFLDSSIISLSTIIALHAGDSISLAITSDTPDDNMIVPANAATNNNSVSITFMRITDLPTGS
jgi:hypothetical protein